MHKENYSVFLVTNQPGVAKGFCSLNDVENFHNSIQNYLISNKIKPFEQIKFCPHHPERGHGGERVELKIICKCRKPENGLIEEILSEFNLRNKKLELLFIGDMISDFELSKNMSQIFAHQSSFTDLKMAKELNLKFLRFKKSRITFNLCISYN